MKKIFLLFCVAFFSVNTLNAQLIYTYAGDGIDAYGGDDSLAIHAGVATPSGVAVDASGNVYIADQSSNRIRKVDAAGIITTFAGTGVSGFSGDSGLATAATLSQPVRIAIDKKGNIYVADANNNRIRKIDNAGIITTVAGTGIGGYNGDSIAATAAQLNVPYGIAVDSEGNIFIADFFNNRVRKVNTMGMITTIAGNGTGGFGGDSGLATASVINAPNDVAVDKNGNVYFTDENNIRVRMINAAGIITTIAGTGTEGYTGDSGLAVSAELGSPVGVDLDSAGNIYISDQVDGVIRKINSSGIITTIVGNGISGYNGDGIVATAAELSTPYDVAIGGNGSMYIADYQNSRVRVVMDTAAVAGISNAILPFAVNVYPDPTEGNITVGLPVLPEDATILISDLLGNKVAERHVLPAQGGNVSFYLPVAGTYLLTVYSSGSVICTKKVIRF